MLISNKLFCYYYEYNISDILSFRSGTSLGCMVWERIKDNQSSKEKNFFWGQKPLQAYTE